MQRTLDTVITERKAKITVLTVLKGWNKHTTPKSMSGSENNTIIIFEPKALILYQFSSEVNDLGILTPYVSFIGILPRIRGIANPIEAIPPRILTMPMSKRTVAACSPGLASGISLVKTV